MAWNTVILARSCSFITMGPATKWNSTQTHQPLRLLVPYISGDNWLAVGPDGRYAGPVGSENHIIHVATKALLTHFQRAG